MGRIPLLPFSQQTRPVAARSVAQPVSFDPAAVTFDMWKIVESGGMRKSELIAAIQKEILRHDFGTFVDNPPSVAQGCATCNKRANTTTQFLEHIANDAIPRLIEKLSQEQ